MNYSWPMLRRLHTLEQGHLWFVAQDGVYYFGQGAANTPAGSATWQPILTY